MDEWGFLESRRYLIHDRDTKFTESFRAIVKSSDVEPLKLPARSPNLNAYAERWVKSVKDECLAKLILFGEASLGRALRNYLAHYHGERNHQGKDNILLFPTLTTDTHTVKGPIACRQRVGCELLIKPRLAIDISHGSRISIGSHRGERRFYFRPVALRLGLHLRVHGERDLVCSTL